MSYYIEFLNASKNFTNDRRYFDGLDAYTNAVNWGKANLENFSVEMIHIVSK